MDIQENIEETDRIERKKIVEKKKYNDRIMLSGVENRVLLKVNLSHFC
jgi:hypothetical protein